MTMPGFADEILRSCPRPARTAQLEDIILGAGHFVGLPHLPAVLRAHRKAKVTDALRVSTGAQTPVRDRATRGRTQRSALLCVGLLSLLYLTIVPSANADFDPVAAGTTKLTLDKRFARLLAKNHVKLLARHGAARHGRTYALPVVGGNLDPTSGRGEIDSEGVLVFNRGRRKLPLRELVVKPKPQPLIAKVGGGQLKLARAKRTNFARHGFASTFTAKPLRLSAKLATRLAKKLRARRLFKAGQTLGTLRTTSHPQTTAIEPLGRALLTLDPAFTAKLDANFISLNPVAPAERASATLFSFPIAGGGSISTDASIGTLRAAGALEFLHLGSGQVFWTEPWFDLSAALTLAEARVEPPPTYPGKLGQVPVTYLAPGMPSSDPDARTITLTGAPLTLQPAFAAYFNTALAEGTPAFAAGELIGYLTFTAQAQ
jgi:hypothetical protein